MTCAYPPVALRRLSRAVASAALLVVLVAGGALTVAAPASAHAELERTVPVAGAVLAHPPRRIVLTFSERVDLTLGAITVRDPAQRRVGTGRARQRGDTVTVPLPRGLSDGTYLVRYRVVSADSHPVSGGFAFSVGAPSAGAPGSAGGVTGTSGATENPLVRALFGLARWAGFVGLVLLIGPALLLIVLWPRRVDPRPARRLVWSGWWVTLAATSAGLVLQVPYAAGRGLGGVTGPGLLDVATSRFGIASQIRIELLVAGAPLLYGVLRLRLGGPARHRRPGERTAVAGLLAVLVATLVTWPLAGHAGTSRLPVAAVASDSVHMLAMAVWIGGLLVLGLVVLPRSDAGDLRLLLPAWSRWAAAAVAAIIVTGAFQAFTETGSWSELVTTTYGRLLLAKVGLLCAILSLAAAARVLVRRRYVLTAAGAAGALNRQDAVRRELRRLRRGVLAEAALGLVGLAVTAVLVQTPPARSVTSGPPATRTSCDGCTPR